MRLRHIFLKKTKKDHEETFVKLCDQITQSPFCSKVNFSSQKDLLLHM